MKDDYQKIDALFQRRFHGAGNHRGALYHSLYGCLLGLNLDGSLKSKLGTERYEDLEVETTDGSLALYQLKCEASKLDYGELEKILRSFAEVILEKDVASCCIVTATGYPIEVENWLVDPKRRSMPSKLKDRINKAAKGNARVADVLTTHLTCVTAQSDDLCRQVSRTIATQVGLTQAAHESFLHALTIQMQRWSGGRETVSRAMIAKVLADVESQFESGTTNPAVAQGFIVPVSFDLDDPAADDFYEGRAARAGHIAALKDVPRANALQDLRRALDDSNVAAIISSSGQGKSALALRHLSDYTTEDFVYEVKVCRTAEDAAAIAQFVRFRLQLDLGVSLLIDNLSRAQGAWNELANAIAGEQVKIVLTSREEDWKLFAGDLSRVDWKRVTPTLELGEARQIFFNLRSAGKLHPSIHIADEAYARVSEAKLLIEYVYLLTQGELLEERLGRQVLDLNGRDPGGVECLRLVSLADQMNLRIEVSHLLEAVEFRGDPQLALEQLENEYLVIQDGLCSGLHPVRSQHLVKLLHRYGIEISLRKLLRLVDDETLPEFTYSLLARTEVRPERIVDAIVERCAGKKRFRAIWEAAYRGSEVRHAQSCEPLLQRVEESVGLPGIKLFPLLTLPFPGLSDALSLMREMMDAERFGVFEAAVDAVPTRDYASRPEASLAKRYASSMDSASDPDETLTVAKAFWLSGDYESVNNLLGDLGGSDILLSLPLPLAMRMAFLAQAAQPETYEVFVRQHRAEITTYLIYKTSSLSAIEEGTALVVSFIVDPYNGVRDNLQAEIRIKAFRALLNDYESYETNPVRPLRSPIPLPYDDAHKNADRESWPVDEIISLNKGWSDALEVVTASDSLAGWEWRERETLLASARLLDDYARFVEKQDAQRAIDQHELTSCAGRLEAFERSVAARINLPNALPDEHRAKLEGVDSLFSTLQTLLNNLLEELRRLEEGDRDRQQAILFGLRDAHATAQHAQDALDAARQRMGLDKEAEFAQSIRSSVERLYRSIERRNQVKRGQAQLDSQAAATARYLHGQLKVVDAELAGRVRLADKALLHTPGTDDSTFRIPSWLFTLEVEDLDGIIVDAFTVSAVFAHVLDSFLGSFIAVPVRRGHRLTRRAYRASAPTLREMDGDREPELPPIWPMDDIGDLPERIFGVHPPQHRSELDLMQPLIEAGERLAYVKAAAQIENDTSGASDTYRKMVASGQLSSTFLTSMNALRSYKPVESLAKKWREIVHAAEQVAELVETSPERFIDDYGQIMKPMDDYLACALALEE